MIPTPNAEPARRCGRPRLNGEDEVCRRSEHVEGDQAIVFRLNVGEAFVVVNHAQHPAELPFPSGGQVDDQRQLAVLVVVGMRTQEVAGCHRMRAEVVAPAQWHAGNTLEERLEFGALERHAKLEVGEGIRTRLESGGVPTTFPSRKKRSWSSARRQSSS